MRDLSGIQTAPDAPEIVQRSIAKTLRPGEIIAGRYEIKNRLGTGGMGDVFRAHDRVLDEDVALKVIRAVTLEDPRALERLRAEVKIARKITHPHVCRVFDVGEDDTLTFLTMELIEGHTLRQSLATGPLEQARALELFRQIVDGVAAAHEKGVIHRDLKPENILLRRDGQCVVADFGLARNSDIGSTTAAERAGTPAYMSPEQRRGDPIDVRSDVFALGLIGRELLAGKSPFDDETKTVFPMERALQEVLDRALAEEPAERFSSAAELAAALVHAQSKGGETAATHHEAVDPKGLTRRTWPKRATWALGIVAMVIVAVLSRSALVWRGTSIARKNELAPAGSRTSTRALDPGRVSMAVLPFENLTSDASWAELCRSAPEAVRAVLRTIPDVLIASSVPADPEAMRATGIAFVVRGNVQRLGNGLRLFAQIEPVGDPGFVLPSEPVEIDLQGAEIAPALDSLRERLLDEARIVVARERKWQRAKLGTTNHLAREKLLAYYRLIDPAPRSEHFEPGLRLLDDAIAADAGYVPARVERAFLWILGAIPGTGRERYERALGELDAVQAAHPGDPDVLVMRCRIAQGLVEREPEPNDTTIARAMDICMAALTSAPTSAHVHIMMARLYDRQCEDERAIRALARASELDRSLAGRALAHIVDLTLNNGQLVIADKASADLVAFQQACERLGPRSYARRAGAPEVRDAHLLRAEVLLALGRTAEAKEAFSHELGTIAASDGKAVEEATALKGLLRIAAAEQKSLPRPLVKRLEAIEATYLARIKTDPLDVQNLAKSYRSIDSRAAAEWIDRLGPAPTCEDAFQRARIYRAAGQEERAKTMLGSCSPKQAWERSCVAMLFPGGSNR